MYVMFYKTCLKTYDLNANYLKERRLVFFFNFMKSLIFLQRFYSCITSSGSVLRLLRPAREVLHFNNFSFVTFENPHILEPQ